MNLLICTQSVDPKDPIAGFFSAWVREFATHAESVTVIALSGVGAETFPVNVRVISLGKEFAEKGRSLRRSETTGKGTTLREQTEAWILRLKYILRFYVAIFHERHHYDAVFVHNVGPKFVILGYPFWKLFRKHIALWYVHKQVDWKLRIAEKLADMIFSSAPEAFRLPSTKVHFLGHGIDTDALLRVVRHPNPEVFTILQVGRITPIKHCEVLIRAAALFGREYVKPFRVLFVGTPLAAGDEAYASSLRDLVLELGLSDTVLFEGGVEPEMLRDYYARAHVTINTVPTGGMDKVVLESAAIGVPVFTTNQTFRHVFGDLAGRCVLPDLHTETPERLAQVLLDLAQGGFPDTDRKQLQERVRVHASLPTLITHILELIYGKTS